MRAVDQQHWPTPEELMEYVDGEGLPAARREIETHLAGCAACRSLADEQHGLTQRMQGWTTGYVPASLQPPARPASRWYGWGWQPRTLMVSFSAAAVILILVSMNVGSVKQRRNVDRVDAVGVPQAQSPAPRAAGKAQFRADQPAIAGNLVMKESVAQAQPRTASVIRTATLRIVAKDFNAVRPAVESIASSFTGFLDHMTVTGDTASARQLRAILRVPGDRMTGALARLRQLGAVVEDTQGAQDVTDQMVDLDARLANARATEQRLTEILKNRTGKLSDVLEVEREVSRVRLEIERIDAEKTNLDRRVTYATIDISITEERKASIDGPLSLTTRLRLAALDGLENALDGAVGVLLFALRAGPSLLLWGFAVGIAWLGWKWISRLKPGAT